MAYSSSAGEFQYYQDILKEWYAPAIVNQVYKKAPFWAQIKTKTVPAGGKRVLIPVRTALTEAVGSILTTSSTLMTSLKTSYDTAYIYMKKNYGRVQVDGFSMEAAKGKGGWIDVMTGETRSVADAFAIEIDNQSMGRGDSILGHSEGTLSTYTLTVDNPHGITDAAPGWSWFRKGMLIDTFASDGSAAVDTDLVVASVAPSSNTVTFTGAPTQYTDGDYLVRANTGSFTSGAAYDDAYNAGSGNMMGIDGIVDSNVGAPAATNFQGIPATTEPTWRAYKGTTTGVLTETKIQEALDEIEKNTDMSPPNLVLTTNKLRNKLINIVRGDRLVTKMKFNAGWKGLNYHGGSTVLSFLTHKFCPTEYMYFLAMPHIKFYTMKSLTWDNKGGGIIKGMTGYDAYEAWFKMYGNIGTDARNAHGKLTGVTDV